MSHARDKFKVASSSRYDFVKVRVILTPNKAAEEETDEKRYVLSRYLISRVLTASGVPPQQATRIALDLKKKLVDGHQLELTHEEMEQHLFDVMEAHGVGTLIANYKMMMGFHHRRIPLIVLVAGTGAVGKSGLAAQLAERLNLPGVFQTDFVKELMFDWVGFAEQKPTWQRKMAKEECIAVYRRECQMIRGGIERDIAKCFHQGKSLIVEGYHIDPSLYVELLERDTKAVVVPFLLTMDPPSHRVSVDDWAALQFVNEPLEKDTLDIVCENFRYVQEYLVQFEDKFCVVRVNPEDIKGTVDQLHRIVLEHVERIWKSIE